MDECNTGARPPRRAPPRSHSLGQLRRHALPCLDGPCPYVYIVCVVAFDAGPASREKSQQSVGHACYFAWLPRRRWHGDGGARPRPEAHTHTHRHILRAYIRVHTHTYTTAAAAHANCIQLANLCRRQRNHGAPSVPLPPLADGRRRREHARTSHLLDSPSTIRTYACTSYYFPSCFVRVPYRNTRSTQSVHRRAGQSTVAPPQCQLAPRRNSSTARTGPNLHTTKIAAEAAARRRPVRLGPLPASDMVSGDIIGAERHTRCQPARPRLRWPLRSFYPRLCQSQLEARARCSAAYTSHSYFVTPS